MNRYTGAVREASRTFVAIGFPFSLLPPAIGLMTRIRNFGRNVAYDPADFFQPTSEEEVLAILRQNRGRRVRVMGRLHSWSDVCVGEDLVLDLRNLNEVRVEQREGETWGIIGAGCQIKRAVDELDRQAGMTLPSLGLITEQAVAGAISTGTHGSGKHCLSHYADEIRTVVFDPDTGQPSIRTIQGGEALDAARCSLGCCGVILSVGIRCRTQYHVEEHLRFLSSVEQALELEGEFPLQQFYLLPHLWKILAQPRRETEADRSWLAPLYRLYWFLIIDVGLHVVLTTMVRWLRSRRLIRWYFRRAVTLSVPRGWKVVDRSQRMLTMEHELFRHIEIEVFVQRSRLLEMVGYVEMLIRWADGERDSIDGPTWEWLQEAGLDGLVEDLAGRYLHHYPICIRRVLPDATMISMSSGGDEDWYAVSFISYQSPRDRDGFYQFAQVLAETVAHRFGARPHWGKYNPLNREQLARLFPRLGEFAQLCRELDPSGQFRNHWLERLF